MVHFHEHRNECSCGKKEKNIIHEVRVKINIVADVTAQ
jgi:hypothetical protein